MPHPVPFSSHWLRTDWPWLWVAAGTLLLYALPYLWLGEGAYLTIHDQLDSDFLYLRLLAKSGHALGLDPDAALPNVMSGLPRAALRSGLNLEVLTYLWLPPYWAWLLNFILIHAVGFVGMYALLRRYVLPAPAQGLLRVGVALLFALVPGYTVHGISVTGQPLLLLAFLNLLNRRASWRDWLVVGLFPFYSFLVWSGLFVGTLLAALGTLVMLRRGVWRAGYVGALALLMAGYALSEWQLIGAFIGKAYVSHRTEYNYAALLPITAGASLKTAFNAFVQTQYHAGAFYTVWIMLCCLVHCTVTRSCDTTHKTTQKRVLTLLTLVLLICLWHGFYRFPATWAGAGSLPQAFQFDRFYFVLPLLWLLLLALSLRPFAPNGWWVRAALLVQFGLMLVANNEWRINATKLVGVENEATYPAYRSFFAEKQFAQISRAVGLAPAQYRVVSVGIPPAVALYNGFYCLDSYQNNYPLPYKRQFRRVIAAELAKRAPIRTYFDHYGNRCYAFSAELGLSEQEVIVSKHEQKTIQNLQLNTSALRQMGCRYVLAGLPIQNAAARQLRLMQIFSDSDSYWRVYVYSLESQFRCTNADL
jgi:hypothetical protein